MNLYYRFICISVLLFTILFSSCRALVEDEFSNFNKIPVLNSILQTDSTFRVQLSFSANLSDTLPMPVNNAQVIIESEGVFDTLNFTEKGWYTSLQTVKSGQTYTCKVNIPDYPQMQAQTKVPLPTEIDSIVYTDLAGRGEEGEKISTVEFITQNNLTTNLFWEVHLLTEGFKSEFDFESKKWLDYFGFKDEYIYMLAGQDSVLLNEANPLTIFSNKFMKSNSYITKFYIAENFTRIFKDETPYVALRSVDEAYYKYSKQFYIYQTASWTDIGKTPQKYPLYSNVINGLGLFCSFTETRKIIEL